MGAKNQQQPGSLPDAINESAVGAELGRILDSPDFKATPRSRDFLRYVVDETLAGRADRIKGYTVAVEVFGRDESFDPSVDPIVRIEAGRLRRALEHYFLTAGSADSLIIDVPKGSYVPAFRLNNGADRSATPASNKPSILILPFVNLSTDEDDVYFAAGMTEELISALAQYHGIRVVPAQMLADQPDDDVGICRYARERAFRFVLTGTVRKTRDHTRVSIRLVDSTDGAQTWSGKYDRKLTIDNLLDVQDEIAHYVVTSIAENYGGAIGGVLARHSRDKPVENLTAYEALLRLHYYNSFEHSDAYWPTREALEHAVRHEPENPMLWAALAEIISDGYALAYAGDAPERERSWTCLRKALSLDPNCDYAHWVCGLIGMVTDRAPDVVGDAAESILKADPSESSIALAGWLLAISGEWDRGIEILENAMQKLPLVPPWLYHAPYLSEFRAGRYETALSFAERFNMPGILWDGMDRAAALGKLGRIEEARTALDAALAIQPDLAIRPRRYIERYIMQDELVDEYLDGLYSAGLPQR
ncbi:MAG: hypothetical protein ACR2QV_08845 [Gammaproteobacteria bacterium]